MKQLHRLLFLQGNKCFFCKNSIPEGQATVEHLHARSKGGKQSDDNAVVCCQAVNNWLGSRSVKEKFEVVLSHRRESACLASMLPVPDVKPPNTSVSEAQKLLPEVVKNLRERGAAKPKTWPKLRKSLATTFKKVSPKVIEDVLALLKKKKYTTENDGKLSYRGL